MRTTPRQLKYFVEIARSGGITTAATALRIAQPALSYHIAAMEEELDVVRFDRHARGVKLTVEGQRLFDRTTSILRAIWTLLRARRRTRGSDSIALRLVSAAGVQS